MGYGAAGHGSGFIFLSRAAYRGSERNGSGKPSRLFMDWGFGLFFFMGTRDASILVCVPDALATTHYDRTAWEPTRAQFAVTTGQWHTPNRPADDVQRC